MSYQTPDREALLREQLLTVRDQVEEARRLRRRYARLMMWGAARLADQEAKRLQDQAAAIEAQLDRL